MVPGGWLPSLMAVTMWAPDPLGGVGDRVGEASQAIAAYRESLALLPADCVRDQGAHPARLAVSYALDGQPEAACEQARLVVLIALETGSGRTLEERRGLRVTMRPRWPGSAAAKELDGLLGSVA